MRTLCLAAGLTVALIGTAFAQSPSTQSSSPSANSSSQAQAPNGQMIRQQVQKNLSDAGFTDIKIMPQSFLVRAKDKSGNPVMMVINPDSITAVTAIPGSPSSTTGSGTSGSSNPSSSSMPSSGSSSKQH